LPHCPRLRTGNVSSFGCATCVEWTILDSNQNAEQAGFTESFDDSDAAEIPTGAKTGAVATLDAELAWLVEVWGSLPEYVRADVLATTTAALSETVAGPS
jgi:hypothetical protein